MKKFVVEIREVCISRHLVEAEDKQDALDQASGRRGVEIGELEWSHDLDTDKWTVRDPTEDELGGLDE